MNFCSRVSFVTVIVLLFAAAIGLPKAEAITYDLNADWSDSSNPNGVWAYNEGINPLPHQANWDPGDFTPAQPAWARSSSMTDHTFLPAWLKLSSAPTFALDLQIGDVALHTTDATNGVGSGPGNVTWTSPITGTVDLSGSVWEARDIGRSNHWSLDINGTVVSQGDISAANSSRSSPIDLASGTGGTAALNNISVSGGEVIKLQFDETSADTAGDFVGVNLTVTVVPTPTPTPTPSQLLNISTRLNILTGDNVLIGGFIVTGTEPKKVIIRGIGPSLTAFGVPGALADPTLELHDGSGGLLATNDNWRDTQEAEIIASNLEPSDDLESAIVATLDPGAYTAIATGKNGSTGVGLVEAYDLDQTASSQLANISTRGFVDTGDNVMIGGFIVGGGGGGNVTVIVRAIGPSLAAFGIANALQDPMLELHDSNGATLASNDDWKDTQEAEIIATTFPPTDDLESAIVATLVPSAYTAIVSGKNNTTGVALVEAYNLQ